MGIVVFHNVIPTRRRSHCPRVHQDPRLVVMDTVPIGCEQIAHNTDPTMVSSSAARVRGLFNIHRIYV